VPEEYALFRDRVLRGEEPVNEYVSLQMNRIDARIEDPAYFYDSDSIAGFVEFCETEMTLVDGSAVKLLPTFKLWAEDALAWFFFPLVKVYNQRTHMYEMREVKRRVTNKQFLIVGRGGAKSMYAAYMQAYFLTFDTSTTKQIVTAPTMLQAEETVGPIRTAIAISKGPLFNFLTDGDIKSNTWSKIRLASTKKGIQNFMTNSIIETRPMSIDKLQGLRSKINTVDEWLSGKVKEDVIGALEQGASKIDDYYILATSSEGTARNGVGDTIKMELIDILRGDYYAPNVSIWYYCLDDVSEVGDPEMWRKANPNLGATVSYESYQNEVDRAEAQPAVRNDMLAKRFGIPVEGFTYFFKYEQTIPHPKKNFDGLPCSMGCDLSQGDDFCAFTFLFPLADGGFGVKTRSYVSESKLDKIPAAMLQKYDEFKKEGTLVVMPGSILNMIDVEDDLLSFIRDHEYEVLTIGYDPYNARQFVEKWEQYYGSFGTEKVIQGARTESVPMGDLQNLAQARQLLFDEELMMFAMGNAVAIQDNNGNYKLSKLRSDEKIDNVAALIDAWVAYTRNQEAFL